MKLLLIPQLYLFCLLLSVAHAAERVSLADGRISFQPPATFTPMTSEEIKVKYPRTKPPQYAYANERRTTSIVFDLKQDPIPESKLSEFKEYMTNFFNRSIAGIKWIKNEFVNLGGTKWIHFEFISYAIDSDIHNQMLFTSFEGKLLLFNFNSTVEEYEKMKDLLEGSKNSILIKK